MVFSPRPLEKAKMTVKRIFLRADRSAQETSALRADRGRYQREKPTVEQLLAEGGYKDTIPLGDFLSLQERRVQPRRARRG